jgi:hypothetical protein
MTVKTRTVKQSNVYGYFTIEIWTKVEKQRKIYE